MEVGFSGGKKINHQGLISTSNRASVLKEGRGNAPIHPGAVKGVASVAMKPPSIERKKGEGHIAIRRGKEGKGPVTMKYAERGTLSNWFRKGTFAYAFKGKERPFQNSYKKQKGGIRWTSGLSE